jgi:hypothetical protein
LLIASPVVLFSQVREDIKLNVHPTTGGTPEENTFFDKIVKEELIGGNYTLVDTEEESDYYFILVAMHEEDEDGIIWSSIDVALKETGTDREIVHYSYSFNPENLEEFYQVSLGMVYQATANIPLTKIVGVVLPNHWRDMWLYLGLTAFYNPQFLIVDGVWHPESPTSFTGMFALEFQFLNFLSVELGVRPEMILYSSDKGNSAWSLAIPLRLKFILKPGENWMIEPYVGAQPNFSLRREILSYPWIFTPLVGVQVASNIRQVGGFYFQVEMGYDTINYHDSVTNSWQEGPRINLFVGVGIKFGFLDRLKGRE